MVKSMCQRCALEDKAIGNPYLHWMLESVSPTLGFAKSACTDCLEDMAHQCEKVGYHGMSEGISWACPACTKPEDSSMLLTSISTRLVQSGLSTALTNRF